MNAMHVRLANDLASRVRHRPAAEAAAELAEYLRSFWDSRMRLALLTQVDADHDSPDPLVVAAVALLRSRSALIRAARHRSDHPSPTDA
jgi:formate dehydrogenase subunit delta